MTIGSIILLLSLENHIQGSVTIGPVPYVRIVGPSLQIGPTNEEVAQHYESMWHQQDSSFVALEFNTTVKVCFQHPTTHETVLFGPYERLRMVDGFMRVGQNLDASIAHFDDATRAWNVQDLEGQVTNVLICGADEVISHPFGQAPNSQC